MLRDMLNRKILKNKLREKEGCIELTDNLLEHRNCANKKIAIAAHKLS